ncbi:tetratricopeptide repeat-containing serine protease family protein [Planktothrix sp. FACHB-1355]|uniref:tetratricopeptide repeat-containing S1 family peptidase n=1 Tax=Planktothrix sp. FACHB-1355 TaxID=2692854 RepID=UPI001F5585F5|nr:tetratricopeptide repeat-containing serine protease family protein [Planktothrix sp. FACHB-1355]
MLSYRWLLSSGCIALLLSGCGSKQLSSSEIANQVEGSVVLINYPDQAGHGTGFFVAGDKQVCTILTARHVVPVGGKVQVQTPDGKIWKDTKVQRFPNQDLAIVTFEAGSENCAYPALKLGDSDRVKKGDTIYIDGFPRRAGKLVKQFVGGSVTAIENTVDGYGISYQTTTAGGMSGGPVVNQAAEVIAVHGRSDVEIAKLSELKGESPPSQQQSTGNPDSNEVGAEVGTFKWGIPSNIYKVNISGLAKSIETTATDFWNSGNDLIASQKYEDAIASYDKAIQFQPDYHEAWYNRGYALGELKRYEDAIASYDKAIQFKPDKHEVWYNRGIALGELKRYEDAIASYDKAIQFKPDKHEAWNNRGNVLYNLKRYEEAIASYDKAIQIKPDYSDAWINRGIALRELKRYEDAIASYDKAIQFKPDDPDAWNNRGNALNYLKRYEDAIASYDKAIQFKSDYAYAWYGRGYALDDLKRYEDAIASYDKAIQFKPDDPEAWTGRGVALEKLKRYEEAIASYDKAIKLDPNEQYAIDNRQNLLTKLGRSK